MEKIALFGFVHADEVVARWLRKSSSNDLEIHGYTLGRNAAFESACDRVFPLTEIPDLEQLLRREVYNVVYVGPIPSILTSAPILEAAGIPFIGPSIETLMYELDKSKIMDVFTPESGILPPTRILTSFDRTSVDKVLREFQGEFVLKFVGDYAKHFPGSEVGRVRLSGETIADEEVYTFVERSVQDSGKVVIQQKIVGRDFSANYLVDVNGNLFDLGENVCYKRKGEGNSGPMTDGTGSYSIAGRVPFVTDTDQIKVRDAVASFVQYLQEHTQRSFRGMLNADLIKSDDDQVYICEINCREAGAHTLASLYHCLDNDLYDLLKRTQEGTLNQVSPIFNPGASVVVSAYPTYFPFAVKAEERERVRVSKKIPSGVNLFTGWVDNVGETEEHRDLVLMSSPSLIFEAHAEKIGEARDRVYQAMANIVPSTLIYRKDIAKEAVP
ncbi:MAG: hypothetical protein Q7K45_02685 [Nanoarchaeota archaeon]|nr:hypothetical protein [Nanoarchaeota archaeon]